MFNLKMREKSFIITKDLAEFLCKNWFHVLDFVSFSAQPTSIDNGCRISPKVGTITDQMLFSNVKKVTVKKYTKGGT